MHAMDVPRVLQMLLLPKTPLLFPAECPHIHFIIVIGLAKTAWTHFQLLEEPKFVRNICQGRLVH